MDFKYKKVIVIGNNGSGKSYFANQLAKITGLPLVHLDLLYWQGGVRPSRDRWAEIQRELVREDKWILDGMHISTLEIRFKEAEAIFFLDFDTSFCLESVKRREAERMKECGEEDTQHKEFSAFLQGVMEFNEKRKPRILELREKYPLKDFIVFKSREEIKEYLDRI